MRIPKFVEDVLSQFENRTEPISEAQVYDALRIARQGQGDLNDEEFKGFRAEASAFFFYERRDCDSVWGTYFAPTFTATRPDGTEVYSPDIKELDAEVVAHWETRAKTVPNPVMRARYADLVWDLKRPITGQRADVEYARIAINFYLEAAERRFYTIEIQGIQWLERALDLALSISDKDRLRRIVEFMFEFYQRIASPERARTWVYLFDDLYGKGDLITPEQEQRIIANLEDMLRKTCDRGKKEVFHPWGAQAASERLETHYQRQGQQEDVKRVVRAYGQAFEQVARDASPMLAMAWLQPVFEKYQKVGLRSDAEQVQLAYLEKAKNVEADMKQVSIEVELPREEVEQYLDWMTSGDLRTSLLRIAIQFIPKLDDAKKFLKKTSEEFPLQALISVVKVGEAGIVARAEPAEEDEEGRLRMHLAENIHFSQIFLVEVLNRVRGRYNPTADQLMGHLYESPIFDESSRDLLHEGLLGYQNGDFVKAIHVLIPQIERALRNLLVLLGIPTNRPVRGQLGIMQLKNINDILADERVRTSLGEDVWRYLQVLLADRRGANLRNRVAHGLVSVTEINRPAANRVFHALLVLSLLREKTEQAPTPAQSQ